MNLYSEFTGNTVQAHGLRSSWRMIEKSILSFPLELLFLVLDKLLTFRHF